MFLCPLFSGSSGNATAVGLGEGRLLVDAGKRLQRQAPPSLHFDATDDALREAEELFGRENVKYQ